MEEPLASYYRVLTQGTPAVARVQVCLRGGRRGWSGSFRVQPGALGELDSYIAVNFKHRGVKG